ncbi:LysR substrate-binding domain-containing protein [Pantoea dispersa]|uniref:LysR substrate-binding domain-containing protein n=1 Tax=Pantoea dispersa TaxID=59814 RepID=UPI0024B7EFFF|nr:LysR substrate-binding domain-containing protein [Pantoea dispersa]MDI9766894.1 LysR substrate-binding domain-containing protein [Pantoea dispersa]
METADLRTLVAIVEQGGVIRAAETLNRVPSAVTTRVKQMEEKLGVKLFIREHRKMSMTHEGKTLYEHAVKILDLTDQAVSLVRLARPGGKFRLGAMDSMASTRLPEPLAEMYRRYPEMELELTTGISRFLLDSLDDNSLDAAFIADAPHDARFERATAFNEELVIIGPADQPLIRVPQDIRSKTVLTFRDGCSYRGRLVSWYRKHGLEPVRIASMSSYPVILGAVAAGMGIGIVPAPILESFLLRNTITEHRIAGMENVVTELLWRTGRLSPNIRGLFELLQIEYPPRQY